MPRPVKQNVWIFDEAPDEPVYLSPSWDLPARSVKPVRHARSARPARPRRR